MKKALKLFTIAALLVMLMVSCQPAPEEIISPDETEDDAPAEGIGSYGPAGGRVFYDCDADNTEEDPDGEDNLKSDVCGWRYLEAAPSLIYKGAEVASTPTVYKTVPEGADVFKALYGYYLVG
ncbi:MAG: hypothetical protein IJ863_02930, partial [Spirochaetales bacterium]|nr:hypothetical protein [Spirochaetales bacterium]